MDGREAFEKWVAPADPESNAYIDMGADEFFIAGYNFRQPEIDELKSDVEKLKLAVKEAWERGFDDGGGGAVYPSDV